VGYPGVLEPVANMRLAIFRAFFTGAEGFPAHLGIGFHRFPNS
jgi:hypothetical protein